MKNNKFIILKLNVFFSVEMNRRVDEQFTDDISNTLQGVRNVKKAWLIQ